MRIAATGLSTTMRHSPRGRVIAVTLLAIGLGPTLYSLTSAAAPTTSSRPGFAAARIRWESEAEMVSSALQNVPLVSAVDDLQTALDAAPEDTIGYATAIATIRQFESIPITSETKRQISESHRDWSWLNTFFDITPSQANVLDKVLPSGANFHVAQRAYEAEPSGIRDGVNEAMLKRSATNLMDAAAADPARAILFSAAIADLESLEGASSRDIAASGARLTDPFRQDIYFLDVYFQAERLVAATGG